MRSPFCLLAPLVFVWYNVMDIVEAQAGCLARSYPGATSLYVVSTPVPLVQTPIQFASIPLAVSCGGNTVLAVPVAINDAAENQFLWNFLAELFPTLDKFVATAGGQADGAMEPAGGWGWAYRPPPSPVPFRSDGTFLFGDTNAPNDFEGNQDCLLLQQRKRDPNIWWNDFECDVARPMIQLYELESFKTTCG